MSVMKMICKNYTNYQDCLRKLNLEDFLVFKKLEFEGTTRPSNSSPFGPPIWAIDPSQHLLELTCIFLTWPPGVKSWNFDHFCTCFGPFLVYLLSVFGHFEAFPY